MGGWYTLEYVYMRAVCVQSAVLVSNNTPIMNVTILRADFVVGYRQWLEDHKQIPAKSTPFERYI